ncbi:MAG: ATPase, T2SS/T4P/T4SS family [Planctomycetota bacterium]
MKLSIFSDLVDEGHLTSEQLEECREEEQETGQPLDRVLRQKGYVTETVLLQTLARRLRIPYREDLSEVVAPDHFTARVPAQFARNFNLVAIEDMGTALRVATCDPLDVHPMDDLATMVGQMVEPVIAPRAEITSAINRAYQKSSADVDELLEGLEEDEILGLAAEIEESEDVLDIANKAPIIKLMNTIMFEALKIRASDIHLQPFEDRLQVRYRIDGILYDSKIIPKKVQDALISRVKVMGKMDIAERRLPQDGRTSIKVGDSEVDVRISSVPTSNGERIVFRLLDKSARLYRLDEIGLNDHNRERMEELIGLSHGILLVTGPTGSGKSTTLYSSIKEVLSVEENIVTVEDPVEYQLQGVNQVPVNPKRGLTFAAALRSILRQDPDTIMIGEIRDLETIEIAIKAALTGHLVFSTLHTNDAPSTITRMIDMGVDPFLVASATQCVAAQRLARRLCSDCMRMMDPLPPPERLLDLGFLEEELDGVKIYEPVGCKYCANGYKGRFALLETMLMTEEVRRVVIAGGSAMDIKDTAIEQGMLTLRRVGILNIMRGKTSIEELLRVTTAD